MPPRPPFNRGVPPPRDEHRINERIRVPRVKLVSETGEMLGEMPTLQALGIARERGYDLVEVAAEARPPVCKLLDYGKYKYEQKKKQGKGHTHEQKVKEVRLRPLTNEHDLETKLKKAREFLEEGDKVLVTIFFRGREQAHKEHGRAMMDKIKRYLDEVGKVEHDLSMTGPRMQITLMPKPGAKKVEKKAAAPKPAAAPPAPAAGTAPAPAPPAGEAPAPAPAPQGGSANA